MNASQSGESNVRNSPLSFEERARNVKGPAGWNEGMMDQSEELKGNSSSNDSSNFKNSNHPNTGLKDDFRRGDFKEDSQGPSSSRDDHRGPSGSRDDFRGPSGGGRDDFRGPPGRDDFRGPPGPRDDFRGPPGNRDDFRGPPGGGRDDFRGPPGRDDFRGPHTHRDDYRGPPGARDGPRDNFRGSPGPRDDSRNREVFVDRFGRDMPRRQDKEDAKPGPPEELKVPIERDWNHGGVRPVDRWEAAVGGTPVAPAAPVDDFKLPTVVDYGHGAPSAPAAQPAAALALPTLEPVATFDYGHGGSTSASRSSPPRGGSPSWRERERERERFDRDRLRERDRSWEREREERERFFRDRDRDRERERDRDRDRRPPVRERFEEDRFGGDRFGDRFADRPRNGPPPSGPGQGPRGTWRERERDRRERRRPSPLAEPPPAPPPPSVSADSPGPSLPRPVLIEDLLCPPGRTSRPANFVIILRGPPGSGKSFLAKLIKDKEVEQGGATPRMLSLDDYFVTEVEKEERDPESGRRVKTKVMEYEYEAAMEKTYHDSLVKAFKKTISDGYFSFLIVDAINDKVSHFEEMWHFAKTKGFQVYICELDRDLQTCLKHNIHNRSEKDIESSIKNWEDTPRQYLRTDPTSMLQSAAIEDVEMEDVSDDDFKDDSDPKEEDKKEDEEENEEEANVFMSKWETADSQGDKMDRLDGLAKRRKDGAPQTLEDWLQLPDNYEEKKATPGKKQVRWADLEERRKQEKMRAIGFVVGQTDWSRMTDPTFGEGALTHTKYI